MQPRPRHKRHPPAPEAAPVAGVWRLTGPGEMVQEASFMRIRITDGRRGELDLSRASGTSRETIALALGYGVHGSRDSGMAFL